MFSYGAGKSLAWLARLRGNARAYERAVDAALRRSPTIR